MKYFHILSNGSVQAAPAAGIHWSKGGKCQLKQCQDKDEGRQAYVYEYLISNTCNHDLKEINFKYPAYHPNHSRWYIVAQNDKKSNKNIECIYV